MASVHHIKRGSTRENVRVIARIRPTNQKEISCGGISCVKFTDTTIEVSADNDGSNNFSFDQIFPNPIKYDQEENRDQKRYG